MTPKERLENLEDTVCHLIKCKTCDGEGWLEDSKTNDWVECDDCVNGIPFEFVGIFTKP